MVSEEKFCFNIFNNKLYAQKIPTRVYLNLDSKYPAIDHIYTCTCIFMISQNYESLLILLSVQY